VNLESDCIEMAADETQRVLLSGEAEALIENLKTYSVKDIGSTKYDNSMFCTNF